MTYSKGAYAKARGWGVVGWGVGQLEGGREPGWSGRGPGCRGYWLLSAYA